MGRMIPICIPKIPVCNPRPQLDLDIDKTIDVTANIRQNWDINVDVDKTFTLDVDVFLDQIEGNSATIEFDIEDTYDGYELVTDVVAAQATPTTQGVSQASLLGGDGFSMGTNGPTFADWDFSLSAAAIGRPGYDVNTFAEINVIGINSPTLGSHWYGTMIAAVVDDV